MVTYTEYKIDRLIIVPSDVSRALHNLYKNAITEIVVFMSIEKYSILDSKTIVIKVVGDILICDLSLSTMYACAVSHVPKWANCFVHNHFSTPEFSKYDIEVLADFQYGILYYNAKPVTFWIRES